MKALFEESQLTKAIATVRENPTAYGLWVTPSELTAIYEELLTAHNSGCVTLRGENKHLYIDGRWIVVKVATWGAGK